MPNIFFISDTHFNHKNILTFLRDDGLPLRDFSSIEEHDEHLIECWNNVVRPQDKVYHLGDVAMNNVGIDMCSRLNGHKRLILGNHDEAPTAKYLEYFEKIHSYRILDDMIFSHIPIHPDSLSRWKVNVHGHLHYRTLEDNRFLCVSCERVNYTPISLDEIKRII